MTKPSRSLSNGRLARVGSSLRVDKRAHRVEAADAERRDRRLAAARDHARRRRRAGSRASPRRSSARRSSTRDTCEKFGPLAAEADRHQPGRHVDDDHRHEVRRDAAPRPLLEQRRVRLLDRAPRRRGRRRCSTPSAPRLPSSTVRPASSIAICAATTPNCRKRSTSWPRASRIQLRRLPVLHLARELGREVGDVEQRDRRRAALARRASATTSRRARLPSGVTRPMPVTTTRRSMAP